MYKLPPFPNYDLIDRQDNFGLIVGVLYYESDLMTKVDEVRNSTIDNSALAYAFEHIALQGTTTFTESFLRLVQLHYLPECGYWLGTVQADSKDRHRLYVLNDERLLELLHLLMSFCNNDEWKLNEQSIKAGWESIPSHIELGDVLENLKVSTTLSLEELDVVGKLFPERAGGH